MDVLTPTQRSFNMSRILSKNTSPEIILRKLLTAEGIKGYRLHYKILGKPDIVFPKKKIAIFIDGCFWHKCKKDFIAPKTNKKFWFPKIENNIARDKQVNRALKKTGWTILRIWEHELKEISQKFLTKINQTLLSG